MTIAELEREVSISHGSSQAIPADNLKLKRVIAEFLPRQLTTDQIECGMMLAGDLVEESTQDPTFFKEIFTGVHLRLGDEDAVIKVAHSTVSPTKEIMPYQIQGKYRLYCVTGHPYVQALQRLCDAVWRKWHKNW